MLRQDRKMNLYRYEGADCSGEATLVEKNISSLDIGMWSIFYRGSDPEETNMCKIGSMSLTESSGKYIMSCCNVVQT